jgi:hypothetical protein
VIDRATGAASAPANIKKATPTAKPGPAPKGAGKPAFRARLATIMREMAELEEMIA